MKLTWLSAFIVASSMPLLAQQSTPTPVPERLPPAEPAPNVNVPPAPNTSSGSTTTLAGCIVGGSSTFTMMNPTVLAGAGAIAPPSPVSHSATASPSMPASPAQPPDSSSTPGSVGTSGTASGSGSGDRTSGAAGTPGSGATTNTVGAQGVANGGVAATPPIANITPDAGVLSTANNPRGYRLTGTNLDSWLGRPVRVVGTVVAAAPGRTPAASAVTAPVLPEFRVQSVQAADGVECPPAR